MYTFNWESCRYLDYLPQGITPTHLSKAGDGSNKLESQKPLNFHHPTPNVEHGV